ncbi:SAV_6107 family HEPN domain-containing protein [Brachybacterium sp. DNPG3]
MVRDIERSGRGAGASAGLGTRAVLAHFDADQVDLHRARTLLAEGEALLEQDPREAFELIHRAALRGAGVLVARANRRRRRRLPLNVWTALARIDTEGRERAAELAPLVAERARLDHDPLAQPEPVLLGDHLDGTRAHLRRVGEILLDDLPMEITALAG